MPALTSHGHPGIPVLIAASILMAATGRGEIILSGDFSNGSGKPTLTITAPITFEITGSGNASHIVFDEWLTADDASATTVSPDPSGQRIAVLNHTALGSLSLIALSDNLAGPQGDATANDGFLRFTPTPVTAGRKFTIASGTYTFSANAAFHPALEGKTFSGKVFLADESMARLSNDADAVEQDRSVEIRNLIAAGSTIGFSYKQPRKDHVVAKTPDLKNWDIDIIEYAPNLDEVTYNKPRVVVPPAREFFHVCELSTIGKIHSGNFAFSSTVISARNGRSYEVEVDEFGNKATMQSQVTSAVGERETFKLTASVDLNDLTIDILGSTATLVPDGLGYRFQLTEDSPKKLVEEASSDDVKFYSQISEVFDGRYDLCSGTISITYTETSRLTWNLTSAVSTATTVSSLLSFAHQAD